MKLAVSNRTTDQIRANLFTLGIISLVTIVVWVGTSVYLSFTKTKVKSEIQSIIKPINPNLDSETVIEYRNSRIVPPETFQIIAKVGEGNKVTEQLIDPFSLEKPRVVVSEIDTASGSGNIASESAQLNE